MPESAARAYLDSATQALKEAAPRLSAADKVLIYGRWPRPRPLLRWSTRSGAESAWGTRRSSPTP
jgi:hypothetical protein